MADTSLVGITELEDLSLFLQERVQAYDTAIDTSTGSTFYNTVILPLLTRLGPDPYNTGIREFILGRLAVEFPNLVLQDGEPFDDYAVKPMQMLLEVFRRQIQQVSNNQSLADPTILNEREANNLGGNYFVRRRPGGMSVGVARLYFSAPQGAIVTPNNAVYDGSGHRFFPVENQAISSSNMLFNVEDNLYFFDIVTRAEQEGAAYNIEPNSLTGIEEMASVVKVSNKGAFEEGDDKETTEEYLARVENSLTEKSLVTLRGINARLLDVFESIRLIQVIGYGDPEMNRDILTGESDNPAPYAYFLGSSNVDLARVDLTSPTNSILTTGGLQKDTFSEITAHVGDIVVYTALSATPSAAVVTEHTVTEVATQHLLVTPDIAGGIVGGHFHIARAQAAITISDIPGGILQPTTLAGTIVVNANEIHLGGMVDVFVRAGDPVERDTVLEGVLDGDPLRFGVDLESFGDQEEEFIHVTPKLVGEALRPSEDRFGNPVTDHILIRQYDDSGVPFVPWKPTAEDVGRYIQILGPTPTPGQGLLEILEVLSDEYFSNLGSFIPSVRVTRIRVSLTNEESGLGYALGSNDTAFDTDFRIVEKVSVKNRVRDRDASRVAYPIDDPPYPDPILSGADLAAAGATIGDSVVIETGDDAGIYSIRKVTDWLDTGDTLILDRDLTKTVAPSGLGDGSGLRYRIADELNVDLVAPKVTKIPLGTIFAGDDLSTVAGSAQVSSSGTSNFLLAGAEAGDILEILEGDDKGVYSLTAVAGTTATLDVAPNNTAVQLKFTIYRSFTGIERPMVRVREIELLDSNSQPTGIMIPYGDNIDARALGVFSNRAEGSQQESFTGATQVGTGARDIRLYDSEVDFAAEGAVPGWRLNVLNTSNAGRYTVTRVGAGGGLPDEHYIEVETEANGGTEWVELVSGVHYTIGIASAGVARLYFQEPTSVEVLTGLAGGRVNFEPSGSTPKEYMFSEVDGFRLTPPEGSEDVLSRDMRVLRNYGVLPSGFESVLELTDTTGPGVLGLEVQVGDLVEVHEQLPFRITSGETFAEVGIFGKPAGIRTLVGSNRVFVPVGSLIDFVKMDDLAFGGPLVGQKLYIDEGPDEGEYLIEEVVNAKTLRVNAVMTASTSSLAGPQDLNRDATLTPTAPTTVLTDTSQSPGTQIGRFITIYESSRGDLDGTYEIKAVYPTVLVDQVQIDLDPTSLDVANPSVDLDPLAPVTGRFCWVNTAEDTNVGHAFRVYKTVPTQAQVTQVATKSDGPNLAGRGSVTTSTTFDDPSAPFGSVQPGDRFEIIEGVNSGVYPVESSTASQVTIVTNPLNLFPTMGTNVPYRIWGGLLGSTKLLTVGKFESDDGQVAVGEMTPFRIIRPGVFRISSTAMNENVDASLYYFDIQVESLGSGDDFNLDRNDRMVVKSGLAADGYTYSVDNNNLTFSTYEQVYLNFDRRFLPVGNSDSPENMTEVSGRNLKVIYETSTTTRLVHDLLRSEAERPLNANPLARHFLPSYVYCELDYRGGSSADEVGQVIEDYINNLGSTDELEVSDLEAFLTKRGATSVEHPITLAVITHDIDRKLVVNRTENKLGGTLEVPFNGTGRISCFFAILGEGLKVVRLS